MSVQQKVQEEGKEKVQGEVPEKGKEEVQGNIQEKGKKESKEKDIEIGKEELELLNSVQEKVRMRLEEVEQVIGQGPYQDTWESLCGYEVPKWYQDAKFGIFIHWGVYAVPAFGSEWYPRNMYLKGTPEYEHHLKTYGAHDQFGYKDFIPMFQAEHFRADEWLDLFEQSGARFIMPVAEHHDGFQMYESELSRWNAKNMGPKRDIIRELKDEADKRKITFTVSDHRAEHCWFFNGGREFESDVNDPAFEDFYWKQQDGGDLDGSVTHDIYSVAPSKEHMDDWLARMCELVDNYRPQIVWFDWWIQNVAFKPYLKKFAAFYYNRAAEWGMEVAINYKYDAYAYGSAVFDLERGQLDAIRPQLWQTDTAIAKNSWCYTQGNDFKSPVDLVGDLVDIVSKNGCLLLNVGPKADGTFTEEDRNVLLEIGNWLKKNGEGIYGTTFWQIFGEGPTKVAGGYFTDVDRAPFTSSDIRFTYKAGVLYAFVMRFPEDGQVTIRACGIPKVCSVATSTFDVKDVSVLGYGAAVSFTRDDAGMHVKVKEKIETLYPVCLKIKID